MMNDARLMRLRDETCGAPINRCTVDVQFNDELSRVTNWHGNLPLEDQESGLR